MQSGVTSGKVDGKAKRIGISETEVERRGLKLELGAPVTGATTVGNAVAIGCGDGTIRFFYPGKEPLAQQAHLGGNRATGPNTACRPA